MNPVFPNLQTIVKLLVGALFTSVVLAVIGASSRIAAQVNDNQDSQIRN